MAKSFKNEAARPSVYLNTIGAQAEQETQAVQEVQELHERQEALATQGKKGAKAQRINMAFTPSNMEFIKIMARVKGQTMTQFVNAILDKAREENKDTIEAIKNLNL